MTNKIIFSVNTDVPGGGVTEINYRSTQTFLDADIVLFTPTLDDFQCDYNNPFQGKDCLTKHESFRAEAQTQHWKNEITAAAQAGKVVIVFLTEPEEYYRYTGKKETSGTGRNQKVTNIVREISSYDALPLITSYSIKTGAKTKASKPGSVIAPYWKEFSGDSFYQVEIEGQFSEVLLKSEVGDRVVGAITGYKSGGAILFLPPVDFTKDKFLEENDEGDFVWTNVGLQAGKKFLVAICLLAKAIWAHEIVTPPPDWVSEDQFHMPHESLLKLQIHKISRKLASLEKARSELQQDLITVGWPRNLLFEKGKLLQDSILASLKLMGFEANSFDNGESEFDAVFSGPEGRFIGEAEGRDSKAINVTKFSQLERNIHEDFSRDDVNKIAKGVLFGNGYRLITPEKRPSIFTEKCLIAAERTGIALVRTSDLFEPTRYLSEHPDDHGFAEACRKSIANTGGRLVEFPTPPIKKPIVTGEK